VPLLLLEAHPFLLLNPSSAYRNPLMPQSARILLNEVFLILYLYPFDYIGFLSSKNPNNVCAVWGPNILCPIYTLPYISELPVNLLYLSSVPTNNGSLLLVEYCVPGNVLSTSCILASGILITICGIHTIIISILQRTKLKYRGQITCSATLCICVNKFLEHF
jgi:hypothetical protein